MKRVLRTETIYETRCDLCNVVIPPNGYWAYNSNGGQCDIVEDGLNGKDVHKWKHLCVVCRRAIYDAVNAAVAARRRQAGLCPCGVANAGVCLQPRCKLL